MLRYLPFVLLLAVWVYAFIDCLNTPEKEVRKLPKVAWVLIILLFGQVLLGPIVWFAVGRPRRNTPYGATKPQERRWVAPDDNPEFLKSINDTRPGPADDTGPGDGPAGTPGSPAPQDPSAGNSPDATEEKPSDGKEARRREGGGEDTPKDG